MPVNAHWYTPSMRIGIPHQCALRRHINAHCPLRPSFEHPLRIDILVDDIVVVECKAGTYNPIYAALPVRRLLVVRQPVHAERRGRGSDAGDPAMKCVEPKPNGHRVNLGCYGNTPWATMSPGGTMIFVR